MTPVVEARVRRAVVLGMLMATWGCPQGSPADAGGSAAGFDAAFRPASSGSVTSLDAGLLDAAVPDGAAADAAQRACAWETQGPGDRDRVVLLSHTSTANGAPGTQLRSLTLPTWGLPNTTGVRLDVGVPVVRLAFVPSGEFAVALGKAGDVVVVRVGGAQDLSVVDRLILPFAGYSDLYVVDQGHTILAVGSDVTPLGGVSMVALSCDGHLTQVSGGFLNVRLAQSLAILPNRRAVLLGGQAVFAPVDAQDTRMIQWGPLGITAVAAFDLWSDFLDVGRLAASPLGDLVLVPNSSPFSTEKGQVRVLSVTGDNLTLMDTLGGLGSPREPLWSADGATVLISQDEQNSVSIFQRMGNTLEARGVVTGIGLPSAMAQVTRGAGAGRVLIPSVDINGGPNVAMLTITGPGAVRDDGQLELGGGATNIPAAVAVQP